MFKMSYVNENLVSVPVGTSSCIKFQKQSYIKKIVRQSEERHQCLQFEARIKTSQHCHYHQCHYTVIDNL